MRLQMRFLAVGAGRVGLRTARAVGESGHTVVVVDNSPEGADRARAEGFEMVEGDGALEATLEQVEPESVEGLAALTGDLSHNIVACTIADNYDCRTVMRIDEDYRERLYDEHVDVVDEVVHPEDWVRFRRRTRSSGGTVAQSRISRRACRSSSSRSPRGRRWMATR